MPSITDTTRRYLSQRVRLVCVAVLMISSLFPPYLPKAALAQHDPDLLKQQFLLVEDGFLMKSSSLTDRGARRAYTSGHVHIVEAGDSIESLARLYGISPDTIRWSNNLEDDLIRQDQELIILPVDGVLHTVSRGQTLLAIAEIYDVPVSDIIERNDLGSEFLLAGQQLIVPEGAPIVGIPTPVAKADPEPEEPVNEPIAFEDDPPAPPPVAPSGPIQVAMGADITGGVLQKPCASTCFVTQYYHAGHYALDMQERGGGAIFAAEAGRVTRSDYGWNGGYGNVIEVDHGNDLVTVYAHNKKLFVSEGDLVKRGQKIAEMGNTGLVYGKTGIHVHFEVRLKGVKKNPVLYIQ